MNGPAEAAIRGELQRVRNGIAGRLDAWAKHTQELMKLSDEVKNLRRAEAQLLDGLSTLEQSGPCTMGQQEGRNG